MNNSGKAELVARLKALHEVSNELSTMGSRDELCRRAVELGCSRLGFDRLGVWFLDEADPNYVTGSFGIDEQGSIRDERSERVRLSEFTAMHQVCSEKARICVFEDVSLLDHRAQIVGRGTLAIAGVWDGRRFIGYLAADDLFRRKSFTKKQSELLSLYATTIGHFCSLKRTEEALRSSEQRYRTIVDHTGDSVWRMDMEGQLTFVSLSANEMFGYSPAELLGESIEKFLTEESTQEARESLERRKRGEFGKGGVTLELVHRRKDGSEFIGETRTTPIFDSAGNVTEIVGVTRDVTERVRAEEEKEELEAQIHRAQRMEAIGELSGGVAHNINNMLTAIIGGLELAAVDASETSKTHLATARTAANRAADLIRQILAFTQKSRARIKEVDLNEVVQEVYRLTRKTVDQRIELAVHAQEPLPKVRADSAEIASVVMSLCVNARDSIEEALQAAAEEERWGDRFSITVNTSTAHIDEAYCMQWPEARPGHFVVVSVSDNGAGMDCEMCRRIFEPFLPTEGLSNSVGPALSNAFGITKQYHGWIDFESKPGEGNVFRVYLPSVRADKQEEETSLSGNGTILVVDDEELILQNARNILEQYGYTVFLAADGREALNICLKKKNSVDLIVLDLSMPYISGDEILDELRSLLPSTKVIVSSGHSESRQVDVVDHFRVAGYLPKPYRPLDLVRKVHELLGQRQ